jgi:hypothetical protein
VAEYQALLKEQGRHILNPAFYDAQRNEIICATELETLGAELECVRQKHKKLLEELKEQEAELSRQYHGVLPAAVQNQLLAKRDRIRAANLKNEGVFKEATQHLFQTLYHEAFHAYLAQFVYPSQEAEVPRWLNEGLAQIFETALVEAGELRVGHVDLERLDRMKGALRRHQVVALRQLLKAGPNQFLVGHSGDQPVSERAYLSAWALAFYFTFDRHLLGTPALDRYVHALHSGAEPLEAFREFVGEPLSQFEDDFHHYFSSLRASGSTSPYDASK